MKSLLVVLLSCSFIYAGGINSRDPRLLFYSHWDEGTGISAKDETGISTGATLINGVAWVSGKKTFGVNLDGTNDRIVISTANNVITLTKNTFGFWFKDPSSSGARVIVTKTKASTNDNRFFLYQGVIFGGETDAARLDMGFKDTTFIRDIGRDRVGATSLTFDDGKWHHVFVDIDNGVDMKIVVDGGTSASTLGYSTHTSLVSAGTYAPDSIIMIGETVNTAGFNWGGTIDEFAIWNTILSDGEKKNIYLQGRKNRNSQ